MRRDDCGTTAAGRGKGTAGRDEGANSEAHPLGRRIGRARAFPRHTAAAAGSSPSPTRLRRCLQDRPVPPPRTPVRHPPAHPSPASVRTLVSSARAVRYRWSAAVAYHSVAVPQGPTDRPSHTHPRAAVAPAVTTTSRRHEMQLAARRIRWMCLLCACALADQHVNTANNDTQTGSTSGSSAR